MGVNVPKVLLVEGDAVLRNFLTRVLRERGCAVEAVSSYREGLIRAQVKRFSLCLTDAMLTDGSGMDLCRQIHTVNSGVPVVICYSGDHDRIALEAGAQAYLRMGDYVTYQLHQLLSQLVKTGADVVQSEMS